MSAKLLIAIAVLLAPAISQENATLPENLTLPIETTTEYVLPIDAGSLLRLKFDLKEDNINEVAAQVIFNATAYNVTVSDLVALTDVENLNFTAIAGVLDQLDLANADLFNVETVQAAFAELNVSALDVYTRLKNGYIPDPRTQVPRLLDVFEIDREHFLNTVSFGTDAELFEILKSANFSQENLMDAFDLIGKTPDSLYEFLKPTFLVKINDYPIEKFVEIVKSNKLTQKHLEDALDAFGVEKTRYDEIPAFRSAFSGLTEEFNRIEVYGVLTNFSEAVTINMVYSNYKHLRHVADLFAETSTEPLTRRKVVEIDDYDDGCSYGPALLNLEGSDIVGRPIAVTNDYPEHRVSNCYYVSVVGTELVKEKFDHVHYSKHNLVAHKSNSTVLKRGSPLICHDVLYGLAEEDSGKRIGFRSFHCDDSVPDTTTIFASSTKSTSNDVYSAKALVFAFILLSVLVTH